MINKNIPLVSVIIPIYNVEKYLRECLDSVVNQTLREIEIILINDGSTDSCGKICDEYATKDKRIIVIHKENAGLGAAYNSGLDIAKGEYIGFVESDDWIEFNMYEELYFKAKNNDSDLVKCMFYDYNSTREPKDKLYMQKHKDFELFNCAPDNKIFKIEDYPKLLIYHSSIWASLYHKTLINRLRFQESKGATYQDFPFAIEALVLANKITTLRKAFYHYRQEPLNASSVKRTDQNLIKMIDQCIYARKKLISLGVFEKFKEEFYAHAISPLYGFYYQLQDDLKPLFFEKLVKFFNNSLNENLSYKYFNQREKDFLFCILKKDFSKTLLCNKQPLLYKF
ncbi:glycosyltransferase, partial [Campylobacter jejuni]|nr:glycosyltransferase [Campylobacter jejuni]